MASTGRVTFTVWTRLNTTVLSCLQTDRQAGRTLIMTLRGQNRHKGRAEQLQRPRKFPNMPNISSYRGERRTTQ